MIYMDARERQDSGRCDAGRLAYLRAEPRSAHDETARARWQSALESSRALRHRRTLPRCTMVRVGKHGIELGFGEALLAPRVAPLWIQIVLHALIDVIRICSR